MKLLLIVLLLSSCSHAPAPTDQDRARETEITGLNRREVDLQLANSQAELAGIEERLKVTRARRDNLQAQASTDVTKQNAVEGTEAELAALQQKRAVLLHEQHLLDGRLRELGDSGTP